MLSATALLAVGFKEIPPNPVLSSCDRMFQIRVRDAVGTRYFIEACLWIREGAESWELVVSFNHGCPTWEPAGHVMRVTAHALGGLWAPHYVLAWANKLWERLRPEYYERD